MVPFWTGTERQIVQRMMHGMARNYEFVTFCLPNMIQDTVNYDPFSDGPTDISDTNIPEIGATVANWTILKQRCRIATPPVTDFQFPAFSQLGYSIGDMLLFFAIVDFGNVQKVYDNQDAYIFIGGNTYRPRNINSVGVYYLDERLVSCNKSQQRIRAPGY